MRARTKSIAKSIGAGALLGAIALAARYAPDPQRPALPAPTSTPHPAIPASAARSAPTSGARAAASTAGTRAAAPSAPTTLSSSDPGAIAAIAAPISTSPLPIPRAARFDADPVARAACPADMALVDGDFCPNLRYDCIRPTETVACGEYARGVRCAEPSDHRRYCVDRHEWPNRVGENPRVYVDWFEAKALCQAAGKRLCRRSEWILACEGPKRLPFPWGFVRQPSPCNIDRASISFDVEAMIDERTREGELSRLWQADRIGSHPDCVSSFGAYDLSGNVDEWTDDQADNPGSKHPSTLNGGYWGPVRDTCRLTTKTHGPEFKFYQVGFRCCADTLDGVVVPPPRPWVEREKEE